MFMNGVPGDGLAFLEMGGKDLSPNGHTCGQATGWLRMKAGEFNVMAEHTPWGTAEWKTELAEGQQWALVLHRVTKPGRKPGRPDMKGVNLLNIDVNKLLAAAKGKERLTLMSVSEKPEVAVWFNEEEHILQPLKPKACSTTKAGIFAPVTIKLPPPPEGEAPTTPEAPKQPDAKPAEVIKELALINLEEPGHRLLIVHDANDQGDLAATAIDLGTK
jgi:hypothetical protein